MEQKTEHATTPFGGAFRRPRLLVGVAALILCAVALTLDWGGSRRTVTIGAVLPLSGHGEFIGLEIQHGMELAVEEINARGGVNGAPLRLIFKDSQINPEKGVEAFHQLQQENPLVVVTAASMVALKVSEQAEKDNRLLFGLVVTADSFTSKKHWTYRYWPTAAAETPSMLRILLNERADYIGVMHLQDQYGESIQQSIEQAVGPDKTVITRSFSMNTQDFASHAAAVQDVDAVIIAGFPHHILGAIRELRKNHFLGTIICSSAAALPFVREAPESEGVYVTASAFENTNYHFADDFKANFQQKYGVRATQVAATGYDFLYMLDGLLDESEPTPEELQRHLQKGFVYSGFVGNMELKPGMQDFIYPMFPGRIGKNGVIEFL